MLKQYQEVKLLRDIAFQSTLDGQPILLKKGQKGIVLEIYAPNPGTSDVGYDVEFFDGAGKTVAVEIVKAEDIREID